jgi:antitoxin ParD1/3/4
MAKNTSITLGDHFDGFISSQVKNGRYGSASEVIRSALRLLETQETKMNTLRQLLVEGEESGIADYDLDSFINELDNEVKK